jgi:hypothetical protein
MIRFSRILMKRPYAGSEVRALRRVGEAHVRDFVPLGRLGLTASSHICLSRTPARDTLERNRIACFTPGGRIPVRHAPRWAWSVVLLAAAVVARADDAKPKDPPKDESPKTAAEQYQALEKEFLTARTDAIKAIQAAKTDEERQKIFDEKYPKPQKYASKFLELAKKYPNDPAGFEALSWLCMNVPGTTEGKEAAEIVLKDHIKSDKLAPLVPRLGYGPDGEKILRRLIAESPNNDVQGVATFRLGQAVKEKSKDEAEKLFEQTITKFADVKMYTGTLGKMAKGELNDLHGLLNVGKPAPEIAGEDIDGAKFKLSDYRGKVVMLDFWGHW